MANEKKTDSGLSAKEKLDLVNAGMRTQVWASAGALLPGPLGVTGRSLSSAVVSLASASRWSGAVGLGLVLPMGDIGSAEVRYSLAHWGPSSDIRQGLSLSIHA